MHEKTLKREIKCNRLRKPTKQINCNFSTFQNRFAFVIYYILKALAASSTTHFTTLGCTKLVCFFLSRYEIETYIHISFWNNDRIISSAMDVIRLIFLSMHLNYLLLRQSITHMMLLRLIRDEYGCLWMQ